MASERIVECIAADNDCEYAWYPRTVSRRAARAAWAGECETKRREWRVRRAYLRPATSEDCPAWPHGLDADGEPPEDCSCWQIEDGYYYGCDADHPAAIPVWKVELRELEIRYRLRRLARRWLYPACGWDRGRYVLWGGRVDRTATWLDKLLIGVRRGLTLRMADHWVVPGESELRWCHSCRATTPHYISRRGRLDACEAVGHGVSKAAPMADDLRPYPSQEGGEGDG